MIVRAGQAYLLVIGLSKRRKDDPLASHTSTVRKVSCSALAAVAIAVPVAQGAGSRDKSGALDPWAYALLHKPDTSSQLDPWAYAVLHKPDTSSQLDPWAYAVLHKPDTRVASVGS
jgi:hypothetical protein